MITYKPVKVVNKDFTSFDLNVSSAVTRVQNLRSKQLTGETFQDLRKN